MTTGKLLGILITFNQHVCSGSFQTHFYLLLIVATFLLFSGWDNKAVAVLTSRCLLTDD